MSNSCTAVDWALFHNIEWTNSAVQVWQHNISLRTLLTLMNVGGGAQSSSLIGLNRTTLESQLKGFLLVLLDLINECDQLEHSPNFTKKIYSTNICPDLTWHELTAPDLTCPDLIFSCLTWPDLTFPDLTQIDLFSLLFTWLSWQS